MMKKAIYVLLAAMISCLAISFCACAKKPTVTFISDGAEYKVVTVDKNGLIDVPSDPQKEGFTFGGWFLDDGVFNNPFDKDAFNANDIDKNLNVYAKWTKTADPVITYTVTFKNYDGSVLETYRVEKDKMPEYAGAVPVRERTAEHTYEFIGWEEELVPVAADAAYTAKYKENVRKYTVIWKNGDSVLKTENLPYGTTPEYSGNLPEKDGGEESGYEFDGWEEEIVPVTKDAAYTAKYKKIIRLDGTVACDGAIALDDVKIQLVGENAYYFDNAVNADGSFSLGAVKKGEYQIIFSANGGYAYVLNGVQIADEKTTLDVTLESGHYVIGSNTVNGEVINSHSKIPYETNMSARGDMPVGISYDSISDRANAHWADRKVYAALIANEIATGNFAYECDITSTVAYGYAGISLTDGVSMLTLEFSTNGGDEGRVYVYFDAYNNNGENVYKYYGISSFKCGGLTSQSPADVNVKFRIIKFENVFELFAGNVHIGTLSKEGLDVYGDWSETNNHAAMSVNTKLYTDFFNSDREYGLLLTSEGLAGSANYLAKLHDTVTLSGVVTAPAGVDVTETQIALGGDVYCGKVLPDGSYKISALAGNYNLSFVNEKGYFANYNSVDLSADKTQNAELTFKYAAADVSLNGNIVNAASGALALNDTQGENGVFKVGANTFAVIASSRLKAEGVLGVTLTPDNSYANQGFEIGITDGKYVLTLKIYNNAQALSEIVYSTIDGTALNFGTIKGIVPVWNAGGYLGQSVSYTFEARNGGVGIYVEGAGVEKTIIATVTSKGVTPKKGFKLTDLYSDKNLPAEFFGRGREYAFVFKSHDLPGNPVNAKVTTASLSDSDKITYLKQKYSGKKYSIIGDSISTYDGVSNDTGRNSTIGDNSICYPYYNVDKLEETWWSMAASDLGMQLVVNNSWAGSVVTTVGGDKMAACLSRAENLHSDITGEEPDVIFAYIGINDFDWGEEKVPLGSFNGLQDIFDGEKYLSGAGDEFATAYAMMIHKIRARYPSAEIYAFTLPNANVRKDDEAQKRYNAEIIKIANYFNAEVIDLYNAYGGRYDIYSSEGLHPNVTGMNLIADTLIDAMFSVDHRYTVTWKNYDGTVLETDENVGYGKVPVYNGAEPERAESDYYYYEFIGWDKEVEGVTEDVTYTAVFKEIGKQYAVKAKLTAASGVDLSKTQIIDGDNVLIGKVGADGNASFTLSFGSHDIIFVADNGYVHALTVNIDSADEKDLGEITLDKSKMTLGKVGLNGKIVGEKSDMNGSVAADNTLALGVNSKTEYVNSTKNTGDAEYKFGIKPESSYFDAVVGITDGTYELSVETYNGNNKAIRFIGKKDGVTMFSYSVAGAVTNWNGGRFDNGITETVKFKVLSDKIEVYIGSSLIATVKAGATDFGSYAASAYGVTPQNFGAEAFGENKEFVGFIKGGSGAGGSPITFGATTEKIQ